MLTFYLGTHEPTWLKRAKGPLFLSRRRLSRYADLSGYGQGKTWALDSGGFSELNLYGAWKTTPEQYASEVRRWASIGGMQWAAVQDWMCEPFVLQKTGLDVDEHQIRTIRSYYDLSALAPEVHWLPVLQGFTLQDYLRHLRSYQTMCIDLRDVPVVGIGSVCRRQATKEAELIVRVLHDHGIKLHGFGFKVKGLVACAKYLASADSMAWSLHARKRPPLPGHTHVSCGNCFDYAEAWRERILCQLREQEAA